MVKIYGISIEGELIKDYVPQEIDLFISSISWEERSPIGLNLLKSNNIKIKKKIIFFYEEVIQHHSIFNGHDIIQKNRKYFTQLFDLIPSDKILNTKMLDESTGLKLFQEFIDKNFENLDGITIILDISVMVKPYFFILLKYLSYHKHIGKIFLLYTEPKIYNKDADFFTRGSNSPPKDMLSFSGHQIVTKNDALIILLGFEGQRAKEVINEINPDVTIPINGFPGYKAEFKDISILLNEDILKEGAVLKNLKFSPANDPFVTKREIEEIFVERKKRYNICIAPLGPKPMALGCCLFVLEHPECRIIYPYPREYNQKASKQYNKTWMYLLEFENEE